MNNEHSVKYLDVVLHSFQKKCLQFDYVPGMVCEISMIRKVRMRGTNQVILGSGLQILYD